VSLYHLHHITIDSSRVRMQTASHAHTTAYGRLTHAHTHTHTIQGERAGPPCTPSPVQGRAQQLYKVAYSAPRFIQAQNRAPYITTDPPLPPCRAAGCGLGAGGLRRRPGENYSCSGQDSGRCSPGANKTPRCASATLGSQRLHTTASLGAPPAARAPAPLAPPGGGERGRSRRRGIPKESWLCCHGDGDGKEMDIDRDC